MARAALGLIALIALAACGTDGGDEAATTSAPCPPRPTVTMPVREEWAAVLPPASIVTEVNDRQTPPILRGEVPLEPSAIYDYYEQSSALEVLGGEDEGHEAEVLATDGHTRIDLKVVRTCAGRSSLRAVIAPEQSTTSTTDR